MQAKCLTAVSSLLLFGFASLAYAVCDPADQIAPNPNPDGSTLTLTSGTACNAADPYENLGTLNNEGTLVNEGLLASSRQPGQSTGLLNNYGILTNTVGATLRGAETPLNNFGTLDNQGNVFYYGLGGHITNYGTWINEGITGAYLLVNNGNAINDGFMGSEGASNSGVLTNNGDFQLFNSRYIFNSGVVVNDGNIDGGLINTGVFYNNGTQSTDAITRIDNDGIIVNAGQMRGPVNNSGQISILAGGTLSVNVPTYRYSQTAGVTTVDGTLIANFVDINGGVLKGSGSITAYGPGGVTIDGGTMAVGNSPGAMSIIGDYTQTMAGSFEAEIGGLQQGLEFDFLSVSGTATLDGLLDVSLYDLGGGVFSPTLGDTFDILSAESIVGGFSSFNFAALDTDLMWEVSYLTDFYGTRDVVQLQVAAVPEPEIYAMMGIGLGLMGWAARRKQRRRAAA